MARLWQLEPVLPARGVARIVIPKAFSFIEDPDAAIDVAMNIVNTIRRRPARILVDQSGMQEIDFCAASLLNALVRDARRRYGVSCEGSLPSNPDLNELVLATGLPEELRTQGAKVRIYGRGEHEAEAFHSFRLREGYRKRVSRRVAPDKSLATTGLTRYLDECLNRFGFALTSDGKDFASTMCAEVLDNAERHSGEDRWWVAGYLRHKGADRLGDCHIVIFNVGLSIAESLRSLPPTAALRKEIETLVTRHRSAGLFRRGAQWNENTLWTLYALQQGVSAMNSQEQGLSVLDNGQGTIKLVDFFLRLGRRQDGQAGPKMAIVSGDTQILFDGVYGVQTVKTRSGEPQRVVTFNQSGSLSERPDAKYVRSIRRYFPGTIISMRFYIDPEFLREFSHDR